MTLAQHTQQTTPDGLSVYSNWNVDLTAGTATALNRQGQTVTFVRVQGSQEWSKR